MYERMLDKKIVPSFDDLLDYSGDSKDLWLELDSYLKANYILTSQIRFPYGNNYGWSMKYSQKNKHICDIFAEKDAFTAHFHISSDAFDTISQEMTDYSIEVYNNKFPCSSGGWLNYRVLSFEHLEDLKKILCIKVKPT